MSLKFSVLLVLIVTAIAQTTSCKKSEPQTTLKEDSGDIHCDLAKMGEKSADASKRSFACAYNALQVAGALSNSAMIQYVYQIVKGSKSIYDAYVSGGELIGDIAIYVRAGGKLEGEAEKPKDYDHIKALEQFVDFKQLANTSKLPGQKQIALFRCLSGKYDALKDLLTLIQVSRTLKEVANAESPTFEKFRALPLLPMGLVDFFTNLATSQGACEAWLDGSRLKSMNDMLEGARNMMAPLKIMLALSECGVSLTYGGAILAQNSMCLAEDLKSYYETRKDLENQRDSFVKGDNIPKDESGSGINVCMRKYGIWLQRQSFYSYVYRASVCADYCAKLDKRANSFNTNGAEILPNESDSAWCKAANKSANKDAVNACVVMCCDQESSCVDSAMTKTGL